MKLTDADAQEIYAQRSVPSAGRALAEQVRTATAPAARVSHNKTVSGRFASRKMGVTIQYASRTLEGAACLLYEYDKAVAEFYDQPHTFALPYVTPGSTRKTTSYTPDFFVIRRDGEAWFIGFEEWRTAAAMENLVASDPVRWVRLENGGYTQPPMLRLLEPLGLQYRIRLENDLPTTLVRNKRLLADFDGGTYPVHPENRYRAIDAVVNEPGITIAALLTTAAPLSVDDVFALIAEGSIGADLRSEVLTDHAAFRLWPDQDTAEVMAVPLPVARGEVDLAIGAKLVWGDIEYSVANTTETGVFLTSDQGATKIALADLKAWIAAGDITVVSDGRVSIANAIYENKTHLARANAVLARIQPFLDGRKSNPNRSERRYLERYARAELLYGHGLPGLFPEFMRCGDRSERVTPAERALADEFIRTQLLTAAQRSVRKVHDMYIEAAKQRGLGWVSRRTFSKWYAALPGATRAAGRWGKKAANSAAMRAPRTGSPVRGDRALERVHIDHTPIDVHMRDRATGQPLGRAWLSVAICAYSRRVVAWTLLFDAPSARTVLVLLREIVRTCGRLPDTLVLDNGKEFHSEYLQTLAGTHGVNLEYRPSGNPRVGGPAEGFFHQITADLFRNMEANSTILKDPRHMSPSHNPVSLAVHTYPSVIDEITGYLELYDRRPIPTLGGTPASLYAQTIASAGARPHKELVLDTAMRALTAFATPGKHGTAKVTRQGVRIRNLWYMCDALALPGIEGTRVPAMYEPLDARTAYVYVNKTWHACTADYPELHGRSEKEVRTASVELRRRLGREPEMSELARFLLQMQDRESGLERDKQQVIDAARAAAQRAALHPAPVALMPPTGPAAIAPSAYDGEIEEVATYEQPSTFAQPDRPAA